MGASPRWRSTLSLAAPVGATLETNDGVAPTQALNPATPGGTQKYLWIGIEIIDELEIRNASGQTLAGGTRDNSFAEP